MSRIPVLIASVVGLAAASSASAQSPETVPTTRAEVIQLLDARFATIDVNKDGGLAPVELQAIEAQVIAARKAELASAVQRAFAKIDTNKDGRLSLEEYGAAAPKIDSTPAEAAAELVKLLDADKNGKVSGDEFKRRTLAGFDKLDANKDGTVTPAERSKAEAAAGGR